MNINQIEQSLYFRVCLGNKDAESFLLLFHEYVHEIDDIIDKDRTTSEEILATFAKAIYLYSHPFYLANIGTLRQLILNCTNAYADSVAWETSTNVEQWQKEWSSHYSHFSQEVALAVAMICGGYEHARSISLEMRYMAYQEHHMADTKERI